MKADSLISPHPETPASDSLAASSVLCDGNGAAPPPVRVPPEARPWSRLVTLRAVVQGLGHGSVGILTVMESEEVRYREVLDEGE
jgi:hypothetical protein